MSSSFEQFVQFVFNKMLKQVFEKAGLPSKSNPYVFNGDFVDRGNNGVEVMAIYFMFQILYPDHVYINRGNHEDFLINKQFGFENEVLQKYVSENESKRIYSNSSHTHTHTKIRTTGTTKGF